MTNKTPLKLIVFDIGGTVFSKGKQAFMQILADKLGLEKKQVAKIIDGPDGAAYRRNQITAKEYWQQMEKELRLPPNFGNLEKLWFEQYQPLHGMPELILELRKNYKVAYLSNNTPERVAYLQNKFKLLDWFDGGLFSYEIGSIKSDGKLYASLLKKFPPFTPEETLLIDDRAENLITPATEGFLTIAFESAEQLKKALEILNLIPVPK